MLRMLVLVAVFSISTAKIHGQTFEEFLGVKITKIHSVNPEPRVLFENTIIGQTSVLELTGLGMAIHSDTNYSTAIIGNDAPRYGLVLKDEGLGVGTRLPREALHVYGHGQPASSTGFADAKILVENRHSATALRTGFQLVNNGPSRFELENTNSDEIWAFQTNNSDNFLINRLGSGGNEFSIRKNGMVTMGPGGQMNFVLHPNGNLEIAGSINQLSDRNAKTAIQPIDVDEMLERVNRLPLASWQYRDDDANVRHVGPMAQDFHAQFGLGVNDTSISTIDSSGVALAAIQALTQRLAEKDQQIDDLRQEIEEIRSLVNPQN